MKKILTLLIILLTNLFCYSQSMNDTSFKNVVQISDNNVTTDGKDYLFDITISDTIKTPVIFVQTKVPLKLLSDIYPTYSKIIVIVPNWTYYAEVSKQNKNIKCAEPIVSSIIYEFKRENGKSTQDSLVVNYEFPKMEFSIKNKLETNQIEIYFEEKFGSVCCPRDQQWDNKTTREEFLINFEIKNNVKVINTYSQSYGEEGEVKYLYSLSGLTNKQKLSFILERKHSRILNRETKKIGHFPKIYTPTIISINDNMKKIQ